MRCYQTGDRWWTVHCLACSERAFPCRRSGLKGSYHRADGRYGHDRHRSTYIPCFAALGFAMKQSIEGQRLWQKNINDAEYLRDHNDLMERLSRDALYGTGAFLVSSRPKYFATFECVGRWTVHQGPWALQIIVYAVRVRLARLQCEDPCLWQQQFDRSIVMLSLTSSLPSRTNSTC